MRQGVTLVRCGSPCLQNFLYQEGLQNLPIYTLGISAGAAFATKVGSDCLCCCFGVRKEMTCKLRQLLTCARLFACCR